MPPTENNDAPTIDDSAQDGEPGQGSDQATVQDSQQQTSQQTQSQQTQREPRMMTPRSLAAIKEKERNRGKKMLRSELNDRAKKAGFASWEELEQAALTTKQPTAPVVDPQDARQVDRTRDINRKLSVAEKRARVAERRLAELETREKLSHAAIRAGVQDVDYAIELMKRQLRGKSQEELANFSEDKFFAETLKASHPYLYQVQQRPAQTAPSQTSRNPPAPGPKQVQQTKSNEEQDKRDARKMTRDDYLKTLKQYGLTDPSTMM